MERAGVVSEKVPDQAVKPWYVYLVRAANGSLYCGISDDPQRRFLAHQKGQGARYFKTSPAQALVYVEQWPDKGEALRQERLVKRLRKSAKEALVASYEAVSSAI
ncbi:GIY-YIG nuclease family protein [Pseudomonas sp. 5FOS]|uniref:GIY-YIG nuclease family protein n=1 Tax=unclassified Pseudomonas TaxID=196821 RepID=UPI001A9CC05A|nr:MULTISPECIES: GIY-YIG nuclease family protein [unclassified Pseudomonas]MCE5986775.1 GIY-YIG nuclease family protein [Pseudomonas sp. LM20]MCE5991673.1 GIY-YIG nuclease family protein [Pseudomonas sp. KCA11]UMY64175.1 GIY-YIG nuclease family protein [Pseudomonas sp. LS.1a]